MAKNNKKSQPQGEMQGEIKGVLLITLGVLILISVLSSSSSGILGSAVRKILVALMGLGAYVFPIIFIFIGICFILRKNNFKFSRKFYGIIIFIINTLLTVQMVLMGKYYTEGSIGSGISKLFESNSAVHGGIVSYLIDIPLYKLLGSAGSYVVFVAVYIVSFILISRVTIYDALSFFKGKIKRPEKPAISGKTRETAKPETSSEKDAYVKGINSRIKIMNFMKSAGTEEALENKALPAAISDPVPDTSINEELDQEIKKSSCKNEVKYKFPAVELLKKNTQSQLNKEDKRELISNAAKLEETLSSFGVEAKVVQVSKGPSVTRFELQPNPGVKVSRIVNLSDDIALALAASGVRIEAPIPGKSVVGIEVPNSTLSPVFLREVIESEEFVNAKKNLSFCLGKDIAGNCVVSDLTKMPHLLIAGATGSGKSVCINTLIISLLYKYSPDKVRLLMVDPKVVELNVYNGIPHLLIPVVTDPKKAAGALNWAVNEMTRRYTLFADNSVRNIEGYNDLSETGKIDDKLPFIVIIIDELADLMMVCPNDIEDYIGRLAQMARAAGMHLVIATQRPSVDVITGVIKANIPSRISFSVSSQIDSRTILDMAGAEKLLGKGDMLFYPVGEAKPVRIQGAFISESEVENVVDFIKNQMGDPEYKEELMDHLEKVNTVEEGNDYDDLLDEATRIVIDAGQASTSLLQRRLKIGYNRAARIIEQLEDRNVISGKDGSKPRQILVERDEY
jgi:S-DNA-T family DNA segregation ATPase FtsK/SpoIIIE